MQQICDVTGPAYRTRLSTLEPGGVIPRHLDDPSQIRVLAVLRGTHAFTFFGSEGQQNIPMGEGELWFVNTAWDHSVENLGAVDRVALLLNLFELRV